MIRHFISASVGIALISITYTAAADDAIIIGGGYNLHASQGQIELNVQYAKDTLEAKGLNVTTYFTDGDAPGNDVFIQHQEPIDATYDALSRVFGDHLNQNREYRSNNFSDISGGTQKDELLPNLQAHFSSATSPQWLIYNGHGKQSSSTPDKVTLELWNNTQLTASELHTELKANKQPLRYAFTQCYSGGFHSIAYEDSNTSLTPAKPQRCGFTAVSAYSLAEGCSASINTDDYRDYTTHFFAALSGYERNGEIIIHDPDEDKDGDVNPREAHLYTLLNAQSTDLSWSTSEDFLDRWEPWYLKWTPKVNALPNNEYSKLFRTLAKKTDITLSQNSVSDIRKQLSNLENDYALTQSSRYENLKKIESIRQEVAKPIVREWPAIEAPFTTGFQQLSKKGILDKINTAIQSDTRYRELLEHQAATADYDMKALSIQRKITQLEKLLHLRRIATLKDQLMQFGSRTDIAHYKAFVACEEMPMANAKGQEILTTTNLRE